MRMKTSPYEPSEPGIAMVGVSFGFGDVTVLNDADFELARGDTAIVTGRNGSGKSTFLHLCAGLIGPQQGSVLLAGHRADAKHPSDLFRLGVRRGFVFQEGGLLSNVSALANVELPLLYHADALRLTPEDAKREQEAVAHIAGEEMIGKETGQHPVKVEVVPLDQSAAGRRANNESEALLWFCCIAIRRNRCRRPIDCRHDPLPRFRPQDGK